MLPRAIRLGIVFALLAGCGPDDLTSQPPSLQGLAVGELGPNHFRLAAMASTRENGGLHSLWQVTRGSLNSPDQLETELVLPAEPGAYPVRLTVQDATGGMSQALFVILHDPNGRTELAPATVASFKQDTLRTAQTQIIAMQYSSASVLPPPTNPQPGLRLAGVDIGSDDTAVSLNAKLQTASVAGNTMATWSALSGSFDAASGLVAKWRPAGPAGLEAVTLSVTNGQGQQSQAVVRLLVDQGVPRDNWLDFVQVQDGRLVRQTFAAIPSPTGAVAAPLTSTVPLAGASPTVSGSPTAAGSSDASASPTASSSPQASGSPSASPSASYSPTAYPSASPSASGSPASYPTMPPSGGPTATPTPGNGSPTPNPSFTPYNPMATPTPRNTASP